MASTCLPFLTDDHASPNSDDIPDAAAARPTLQFSQGGEASFPSSDDDAMSPTNSNDGLTASDPDLIGANPRVDDYSDAMRDYYYQSQGDFNLADEYYDTPLPTSSLSGLAGKRSSVVFKEASVSLEKPTSLSFQPATPRSPSSEGEILESSVIISPSQNNAQRSPLPTNLCDHSVRDELLVNKTKLRSNKPGKVCATTALLERTRAKTSPPPPKPSRRGSLKKQSATRADPINDIPVVTVESDSNNSEEGPKRPALKRWKGAKSTEKDAAVAQVQHSKSTGATAEHKKLLPSEHRHNKPATATTKKRTRMQQIPVQPKSNGLGQRKRHPLQSTTFDQQLPASALRRRSLPEEHQPRLLRMENEPHPKPLFKRPKGRHLKETNKQRAKPSFEPISRSTSKTVRHKPGTTSHKLGNVTENPSQNLSKGNYRKDIRIPRVPSEAVENDRGVNSSQGLRVSTNPHQQVQGHSPGRDFVSTSLPMHAPPPVMPSNEIHCALPQENIPNAGQGLRNVIDSQGIAQQMDHASSANLTEGMLANPHHLNNNFQEPENVYPEHNPNFAPIQAPPPNQPHEGFQHASHIPVPFHQQVPHIHNFPPPGQHASQFHAPHQVNTGFPMPFATHPPLMPFPNPVYSQPPDMAYYHQHGHPMPAGPPFNAQPLPYPHYDGMNVPVHGPGTVGVGGVMHVPSGAHFNQGSFGCGNAIPSRGQRTGLRSKVVSPRIAKVADEKKAPGSGAEGMDVVLPADTVRVEKNDDQSVANSQPEQNETKVPAESVPVNKTSLVATNVAGSEGNASCSDGNESSGEVDGDFVSFLTRMMQRKDGICSIAWDFTEFTVQNKPRWRCSVLGQLWPSKKGDPKLEKIAVSRNRKMAKQKAAKLLHDDVKKRTKEAKEKLDAPSEKDKYTEGEEVTDSAGSETKPTEVNLSMMRNAGNVLMGLYNSSQLTKVPAYAFEEDGSSWLCTLTMDVRGKGVQVVSDVASQKKLAKQKVSAKGMQLLRELGIEGVNAYDAIENGAISALAQKGDKGVKNASANAEVCAEDIVRASDDESAMSAEKQTEGRRQICSLPKGYELTVAHTDAECNGWLDEHVLVGSVVGIFVDSWSARSAYWENDERKSSIDGEEMIKSPMICVSTSSHGLVVRSDLRRDGKIHNQGTFWLPGALTDVLESGEVIKYGHSFDEGVNLLAQQYVNLNCHKFEDIWCKSLVITGVSKIGGEPFLPSFCELCKYWMRKVLPDKICGTSIWSEDERMPDGLEGDVGSEIATGIFSAFLCFEMRKAWQAEAKRKMFSLYGPDGKVSNLMSQLLSRPGEIEA